MGRLIKQAAPTLEDVAAAAQVSTATISRAINNPQLVAEPTRARIQNAIDRLGYTSNFGGRVLASNRIDTIGAVIPSMSNAMFASGLQAFQQTLSKVGVTMLVASTGYNPDVEFDQIRALMTHGAGGLLLIGADRPAKTTEFLRLRRVAHVISWCFGDDPGLLFVGFDNRKAAFGMATAVLERGHRNIAMIAGVSAGNDRAKKRIIGVQAAIAAFGQGAHLVRVIEAPYTLADAAHQFDVVMAGARKPTAIICGNDVLAAGAIMRARERGVAVPGDVSITGFDDIGLARVVDPALTTVRVPQIEMGRTAAEKLLARLAGDAAVTSHEFDTEIIFRASLGPVPSGAPQKEPSA